MQVDILLLCHLLGREPVFAGSAAVAAASISQLAQALNTAEQADLDVWEGSHNQHGLYKSRRDIKIPILVKISVLTLGDGKEVYNREFQPCVGKKQEDTCVDEGSNEDG